MVTKSAEKIKKLDKIAIELEIICRQHHGNLRPRDVVDFARNPKTALHSQFTWNDDEAAELYRLHQARRVIRVMTITLRNADDEPLITKMYVSLPEDRGENGYRTIVRVMSDETMRAELLQEALREFKYFKQKYAVLDELREVFEVMDKVKK